MVPFLVPLKPAYFCVNSVTGWGLDLRGTLQHWGTVTLCPFSEVSPVSPG